MRKPLILLLSVVCGLTACSSKKTETLPIPSPSKASAETTVPAGEVWSVGNQPDGIASAGDQVAVAVEDPSSIHILDRHTGTILRTVPTQKRARHITAVDDVFYAAAGREVVAISRDQEPEKRYSLPAKAHSITSVGNQLLVTLGEEGKAILLDAATGELSRTFSVGSHAGSVSAIPDALAVIDSQESTLALYNSQGEQQQKLRAGDGAINVVADKQDRLVVLDARGSELLVYDTDPLFLLQRYPLPGGPYGLTYDAAQNIAWVTLTATNEVVGLELSGGSPRKVARYDTVRQPNSVTIDATTGTLYVTGAAEGKVQAITTR